jgi:type VI secretion system protein ImpM
LEALRQNNAEIPKTPIHFIYRQPGGKNALVGVMRASKDKVGREFPAALFASVEVGMLSAQLGNVPFLFGGFLGEALGCLNALDQLSAEELEARIEKMTLPGNADLARAQQNQKRIRGSECAPFNQAVFGQQSDNRHYYGYYTLAMAIAQSRKAPESKPGITLECPCKDESHIALWLEVIHGLVEKKGPWPCVFWCQGTASKSYGSVTIERLAQSGQPKLYVAFGAPSPQALLYIAKPDVDNSKLWPLYSDHAKALELTKTKLTDKQRQVLDDPTASVAAVVAAFV